MNKLFLAHMTQGIMWHIAITWCPSTLSSVNFYILIFFSETTRPIKTKLGRNVQWMVPYKVYIVFVDRSTQQILKKQEAQMCQKGCVQILVYHMGINYLLISIDTSQVFCDRKLMRPDTFFTRTTKPICNFVKPCEHSILHFCMLTDFLYIFCIFELTCIWKRLKSPKFASVYFSSNYNAVFFFAKCSSYCYFILKWGLNSENSHIERYVEILFFIQFWCVFCCWMDYVESFQLNLDRFPLSFTVSEINLTERSRKVWIFTIWKFLFLIEF